MNDKASDPPEIELIDTLQDDIGDCDWRMALEIIYARLSLSLCFKDGRYSSIKEKIADFWRMPPVKDEVEASVWEGIGNVLHELRILAREKQFLNDLYERVSNLEKQGLPLAALTELLCSLSSRIDASKVSSATYFSAYTFVADYAAKLILRLNIQIETGSKKMFANGGLQTVIDSLFLRLRNPDAFNNGEIEDMEVMQKGLLQLMALKTTIPVQMDYATAFMVANQLQLAYRHPANQGRTEDSDPFLVAFEFARQLQARIREVNPDLGRLLDAGWHPECDKSPLN